MITESAAEIEDQRVVARRLFDAMCAQFPDKYIALIQPRASEISRPKATASPQYGRISCNVELSHLSTTDLE